MENESLVLDLVEWVAERPRAYQDVMDAWRSSCPMLTIWEDAVDAGYVRIESSESSGRLVTVTERGQEYLLAHGRRAERSASPARALPGRTPLEISLKSLLSRIRSRI